MELQFNQTEVSYLNPVVQECRNLEQTQEVRLSDGMPDLDRILGCWGQFVLRGKEWRTDTVSITGGVMLWVMYRPEDGGAPVVLDGWVPFGAKWELPRDTREGKMLVQPVIRFLDARSVSPRKVLVRCGVGVNMTALAPEDVVLSQPGEIPEDVQLRLRNMAVRLYAQAGEKSFALEEPLPGLGADRKILYCTAQTALTDQKVVGDKIAFRGSISVHTLLRGPEGQVEGRELAFPFSQLVELDRAYGSEAEAELQICVTNLETEEDSDGTKRVRGSFAAQYAVSDVTEVQMVEDGYSTQRDLTLHRQELPVHPILERRWETLSGEAALPEQVNSAVDLAAAWEFPTRDREAGECVLEASGTVWLLSQGEQGPEGHGMGWSGRTAFKIGDNAVPTVTAMQPGAPQLNPGAGKITVENRVRLTLFSREGLTMVSSMELGEPTPKDPNRPSLLLCRAGDAGLWELAKGSKSTMEAIARANGLEGEPQKGQMLLIPVP